MKRYRLIVFLIIFTLLMAFGVSAKSAKAVFEIKTPEELPKEGETFDVLVELSDCPDICGVKFTLVYDKLAMSCDKASLRGDLKNALGVTNPNAEDGAIIVAASATAITVDGVIAKFVFTADEDITGYDFKLYNISLLGEDNEDIDYIIFGSGTEGTYPEDSDDKSNEDDKDEAEENSKDDFAESDSDEALNDKDSKDEPDDKDSDKNDEEPKDKVPDEDKETEDSKEPEEVTDKDNNKNSGDKTDEDEPKEEEPKVEESDKESEKPVGDKDSAGETETKPSEEEKSDSSDEKDKPSSSDKEEKPVVNYNFPDVSGHWSEEYVIKAAKLGLFIGDTDGNFRPDDNVTRAQFITVLWRMAGREKVDVRIPFTDVETQIPEFKDAIAWGYSKGYINGISETEFDPSSPITREAGMKILHYYSGADVGMEIQFYPIYDGLLKDSSQISSWAKPSVYWGIYNKLISGMTEDTMVPKGNATRAQLAKILVNYLDIN